MINGTENNHFTYLGQEWQEELGLNWHSYKWRNADPALGRFFGSDPIAEKFYYQTNYQFASNNPIWKIELEGLEGVLVNNGTDLQDDSWKNLPIFNNTGKGKPVLTFGLHNVVLPTAERTEGDFIGNVAKSIWNGVATSFNEGMQGKTLGEMQAESSKPMTDMAERVLSGEGTTEDFENIAAAGVMVVVKGKIGPNKKPTVKQQALDIKKNLNGGKNSVNVGTVNGTTHFDLDGATHKGVGTPHVQQSLKNVNPRTGETFINKNRKDVRPMTQQDIRTVRKVLEKRQQNNGN